MTGNSLLDSGRFKARAFLIGERIDIRALEASERLAVAPTAVTVRGGGIAVLHRYGAVVLFGVAPLEQATFLAQLQPLVSQPYPAPEAETLEIRIDPAGREGMEGSTVILNDAAIERLQLVADILGKSVVLAQYESKVSQSFERIEPFAANLEKRSPAGRQARELLRYIGSVMLSEHNMVGRVEVAEKPDLLWERPELERLYLRLQDEFEINDRHAALERKLELISRTAHTVLELLQNRRNLRVEWYIVILIVFEIILSLYEMFFRQALP